MIVVSAKDLTKAYGTDVILDKVSFHINKGERVGIIGVNDHWNQRGREIYAA